MKIAIDITSVLDQYADRGIGNYTKSLLGELLLNNDHEWHLLGFLNKKINLKKINDEFLNKQNIKFHSLGPIKPSSIHNLIYSKKKILPLLNHIKPDIYFVPNFERGTFKGSWKNYTMIHDIIPLTNKSYSRKSFIHNFLKGLFYKKQLKSALKSDVILTNSNYSKSQICQKFKINPEKIFPIHLAAANIFDTEKTEKADKRKVSNILHSYGIKDDFILYYGGLESNKNLDSLLKAYEIFSRRNPNIKLVIVSPSFTKKFSGSLISKNKDAKILISQAKKLGIRNKIIFTGKAEFKHLPHIVSRAKAVIYLSNAEGFGLPVLESLSVGTPCVVSDLKVFHEIYSKGVLFVQQKNPNEIAEKISTIINEKIIRNKLVKQGLSLSEEYQWEDTAEKTLSLFQDFLESTDIESKEDQSRITFISPFFFPFKGGAENYAYNIARMLKKEGFNVEVLTSTFKAKQEKLENSRGIAIHRFRTWINQYYLRFYPGLLKGIIKSNADVIHVQGFGFIWQDFCLIIKRFFSRRRIKFISTPHGPFMARREYSFIQKILKQLFTKIQRFYLNWLYDLIIQVNPNQSKWISKNYKIDLEKIKHIPIGISLDHFEEVTKITELKKELNIKKEIVISYLGRFHKYKGVHDLLEVSKELKKDNYKFKTVFMGVDAGEKKSMQSFVIENSLDDEVIILEKPTDEKRNKILEISEIFVFPSQWEAYGIAMVEAMAHGNTIISTKTEGGLHLIENKKNGLLITYKNRKELKMALVKLITDETLRKKMIKLNLEKAAKLKWDDLWEEYKVIYE